MKHNSLFTKLVALMLSIMAVFGCLSFSAFAANDWEGDIDIVAPVGPIVDETLKFSQKGIAFKDYVGLQFILSKTVANKYDKVYVDVIHSVWENGAIVETPVEIIPAEFSSAYRFEQEILAWSMNEQVSVTLYGEKDGVVYQGESFVTSVAALALEKIVAYDKANNAKAVTALVDMLNYGAAVQTGYNHNAESLPNANLGDYASKATAEDPAFEAVNSQSGEGTIAIYRDSVSMQSKVEMQVIFNVDVSAYELRYTVNGVTTTIPSSEFTVTKFTKVAIGIPASNMRAEYEIALYDPATGEAVTPVLTRTVEAYAKNALEGNYRAVVIAMLKYGDAIAAL